MAECMFSRAAEKLRLYFVLTDATSYSATLWLPCFSQIVNGSVYVILRTVIYLVFWRDFNINDSKYRVDMVCSGLQV